jgi:hypothetical protein
MDFNRRNRVQPVAPTSAVLSTAAEELKGEGAQI